jgi:GrpB protein
LRLPPGGDRDQRDAVRVDDDVVLAAGLAPIHGGRAGGRSALHRPDVTGVDCGTGKVQQVRGAQLGEQQLVQLLPNACLVPVTQPPPAGHPGAEAEFLWQEFPANPRVPGCEQDYIPALEAIGFRLKVREPWWYGHRMLRADQPLCNLHVFGFDSPELVKHRIFRDWLRGNPADRDRYAAVKRRAASEASAAGEHVMQQYSARKQQATREIYRRAFLAAGVLIEGGCESDLPAKRRHRAVAGLGRDRPLGRARRGGRREPRPGQVASR